MCVLLTKKGYIKHYIDHSNLCIPNDVMTHRPLFFYVGTNDEYVPDVHTEQWDKDTCLEYIVISENLLLEQYDMIVEKCKKGLYKDQAIKQDEATLK